MALLGVVYLTLGSDSIVSGYHIQQMTRRLTTLQRENAQLEAQIAAFEAVGALQSKAEQMGFVPADPEEIEYLPVDGYPPVPGEGLPDEPRVGTEVANTDTDWADRMARAFTGWMRSTAEVGGGGESLDY
jgi:hypothetical protein